MAAPGAVLLESHLAGIPLLARGKVRDIYDLGDRLLLVATDRISAFDCILGTGIPRKGEVLTRLALFWFDWLKNVVSNHVLVADFDRFDETLLPFRSQLQGRSMIVRKAAMLPVECVARGYLAGSGWKEYLATGSVCGVRLPEGLLEGSRLPEPIFTPATKAESGHDQNVTFDEVVSIIGADTATGVRDLTLDIYRRAAAYAETRGILVADTKFEFGFHEGELLLADEVLTPDSSRFWPKDLYRPGQPQPSYDKQYVRDYLEGTGWDKRPPGPELPPDVADKTSGKYQDAYRYLTAEEI